ncbi:MAG: response regulator transcription factor [Bacteroidetes bacterium]|nr:response regulator transcription factor [Bacteroidota bacterium]
MKILIIEDEPGLREGMKDYLIDAGNVCEAASDFYEAIQKIQLYRYDCIILDITLPGGSGLQVLEMLKHDKLPDGVLIVSAKNALPDRLSGLKLGADDYLTKPFHLSELLARVEAIVRRRSFNGSPFLEFNEIRIDLDGKQVTVNGKAVHLSRRDYMLLLYLIANKNKIVSKNAIAEHLWGDDIDMVDRYDFIYTHIKNLRRKLMDAGCKDYIQSAYGMGYKFSDK